MRFSQASSEPSRSRPSRASSSESGMSERLASDCATSWRLSASTRRCSAAVRWVLASCSFSSATPRCSSATWRCWSARVAFCSAVLRWRRAKPASTRATTRPPERSALRIRSPRRSRLARQHVRGLERRRAGVPVGLGDGLLGTPQVTSPEQPAALPARGLPVPCPGDQPRVLLDPLEVVSRAASSRAKPASKSSPSRRVSQLWALIASGRSCSGVSRRTRGTIRLPTASACSASSRHTGDAALSGLTPRTRTRRRRRSPPWTSSIHLADGRDALPVDPHLATRGRPAPRAGGARTPGRAGCTRRRRQPRWLPREAHRADEIA